MSKPKNMTPEEEVVWKEKQRVQKAKRYATSEGRAKQKSNQAKYEATPERKAYMREYLAKYRADPENKKKAKEAAAELQSTPEGKLKNRKRAAKWLAKPGNREVAKQRVHTVISTPEGKSIRIANNGKRRALERKAVVGDIKEITAWLRHWKTLPVVFCYWCEGAFRPNKCHGDHVLPLAKGGAHCRSNMVISCATCNLRKNAKHPDEWTKELADST